MKLNMAALKPLATMTQVCLLAIAVVILLSVASGNQNTSTAQVSVSPPVGTIMAYAGPVNAAWETTSGWMLCDGRAFDRNNPRYRALFSAIGTSWGGDGAPNFNIPDLRGRFVRGVDRNIEGTETSQAEGGPRDPDRGERTVSNPYSTNPANQGNRGNNVGSMQADIYASHRHDISPQINVGHTVNGHGSARRFDTDDGPSWSNINEDMFAIADSGGRETRPKNAYVYWIIRYR